MDNLQVILNMIGNLSNAIAAICAIFAICVTVWNFRSDRQEQKREKLSLRLCEIYKQAIIDSVLKIENEKINYINNKLYKMSLAKIDENEMKELSQYIMSEVHDCLKEIEMIKLFNEKLCKEVKLITEKIFDTYSNIINKAMKTKYISKNYDKLIKTEWIRLEKNIYECYIEEKFDQL